VGAHKARALLLAGAAVTVVSPVAHSEIAELCAAGLIAWHARRFAPADLDDAWLVVAATQDPQVNEEIARAATARCLFVNAVDDPAWATAFAAALLRRGPITVALSSAGRAPVLLRLLREILGALLPDEATLEEWTALAEHLRGEWRDQGVPVPRRFRLFLKRVLDLQEGRREASA
jgi:uroporphyrin-III C-methyltransferase/precorrin-2 dehydrogenase/sirohydrochlorin ferrochelatase